MSFRSWMYVFAIGLITLPSIGVSQEEVEGAENGTDSAESQSAQQDGADFSAALEGIESAIRDLIREESEDERQRVADQATKDLEAQTEMAKWAFEVAVAAIATAIITFVGLVLIGWTLKVSQRTLKVTQGMAADTQRIGEAQVKAYLSCKSATFKIEEGAISALIVLKNSGQSPALKVRCVGTVTLELVGGMPENPRMLCSEMSTYSDTEFNPIPASGTVESDLMFFHGFHFGKDDDLTTENDVRMFEDANQVSFDATVSWDDVFGDRHDFKVYLSGGIDAGPYYPDIQGRLSVGDMEVRTEDPKKQEKDKPE